MTKKIYGDLDVSHNIQTQGVNNTIRDISNVTADSNGELSFPYYTKEYIDKILTTLPISRVGTMDYLPLNINGSFGGATNYIGKGVYPIILENDGTLVYLRAGTNGSTFGYYYCYVSNARVATSMQPVLTNEVFVPSIFDQNHSLSSFISSNANDVLMMRTNNGTADTYVISLTNNTLNPIAHQSVEFPRTSIVGTDPQFAMLNKGVVYIWCIDNYSPNTAPLSISLYTITAQDIANGVSTSLTKVSGFNGTNLYGDIIQNSPNIQLTNSLYSVNVTDKPLYTSVGTFRGFSVFWGNNEGSIQAAGDSTSNKIRVAFFHACEFVTQQQNVRNNTGISFVYDTVQNTYTFDSTAQAPVTVTATDAGIITYNNPFFVQMDKQISGLSLNGSLNRVPTFFVTNDGISFVSTSRHDTFPEHYVTRSNISNYSTLFDSWNFSTRLLSSQIVTPINPQFGSPIGENLINPTILSSTKIILHATGTNTDGTFIPPNSTVYTSLGTDRTYQYNSVISGNTLQGYAPNADRGLLNNDNLQFTGTITIVDASGNVSTYGSSFIEGFASKPAGGLLNINTFQFGSGYTIQDGLLSTLKTNMINSVTMQYTPTATRIALYYVPDGSFTKSYAIVTGINNAPTGSVNTFIILCEVDVVLTGTVLTSVTIASSRLISRNIAASNIGSNLILRQCGLTIARYADFTYVGISGIFSCITSADNFYSLLCKVDNTSKLITGNPTRIESSYNSSTNGSYQAGVLPNIGFGLFENGPITDIKTKLVFKNFGTTAAQFDAMVAAPAGTPIERIVIASQDVAQGFIVYFTQDIPVLLNGKYSTLTATSIDLNTIDSSPQNKTFYIYVVSNEGVINYQISSTMLTEELYRVNIGEIITGASAITSISTEKVTRFLTYRTSTTKRGSAIPTSTGVPSSPGTRWH